jgi:hypothetical protein
MAALERNMQPPPARRAVSAEALFPREGSPSALLGVIREKAVLGLP